jgi:hypothetical protein
MASREIKRYGGAVMAVAALAVASVAGAATASASVGGGGGGGVPPVYIQIEPIDPTLTGEQPQPGVDPGGLDQDALADAGDEVGYASGLANGCGVSVERAACPPPDDPPDDPSAIWASEPGATSSAKIAWRRDAFTIRSWVLSDTACDNSYVYVDLYVDGYPVDEEWNTAGCHHTVALPSYRVYRTDGGTIGSAQLEVCTWNRSNGATKCADGPPNTNPYART